MNSSESFSFYLNQWILKNREDSEKNDELTVYNYQCEDCSNAFVTDVPWMYKCDNCHKNYFEDANE